jgi:peptide/nickel transport system substrate-binding protein
LNLELLVGIENSFRVASAELIKYQFARVGIDLKVTELSHTDLLKRIKSGKFDLYIGEIRLSANMSLSPIFSRGGNASYGIKTQGKSAEAYSNYLAGELNMQQFTDVFTEDVPFIPLCWRNGIAAYNRSLSGVTATAFNAYYGIENWTYS